MKYAAAETAKVLLAGGVYPAGCSPLDRAAAEASSAK